MAVEVVFPATTPIIQEDSGTGKLGVSPSTGRAGTSANFFTDGAVMNVPMGGGTPTTLASGQGYPVGIAVDDTSVYWANLLVGTVLKVSPK